MTFHPARGTALRTHRIVTRFAPINRGRSRQKFQTSDIPKIRALLRTEMTLTAVAAEFGVTVNTLRNFVKRRRICDLTELDKFIRLQKSVGVLGPIE